jgi:hypothetical protein
MRGHRNAILDHRPRQHRHASADEHIAADAHIRPAVLLAEDALTAHLVGLTEQHQPRADGDVIAAVSALPFTGFVPGTEKGHGTKVRPEAWKELPKVKEMEQKMITEVGKVSVAAKSGNLDQLKAAFGPASQTCKACHDNYRAR